MTQLVARRSFLKAAAASAAAMTTSSGAMPHNKQRQILVAGGGVLAGWPDWLLLRYLLSLTGKSDPVVYLLATADGDNLNTIATWYEAMNGLPCRPHHLRLFGPSGQLQNFERQLLSADSIFVSGGNTLNMLAVWRAQGIDIILRNAWEQGIVLAGQSAGMICWFEQGVTDSRPEQLSVMDGLGWLKGSACPHYHTEPNRLPSYHKMIADHAIKEGVACDNGAAILFSGESMVKVVSTVPGATAYRIRLEGGRVVDEPLKTEKLTK
jgi:peptidase E